MKKIGSSRLILYILILLLTFITFFVIKDSRQLINPEPTRIVEENKQLPYTDIPDDGKN